MIFLEDKMTKGPIPSLSPTEYLYSTIFIYLLYWIWAVYCSVHAYQNSLNFRLNKHRFCGREIK